MKRMFFAALAGGLFGAGLLVSGMTDTTKVQGWLDIFGAWDPTLAFVMGGGIIPMFIAWRIAAGRRKALLGTPIPQPSAEGISPNLITGSLLFGAGWGLAGLCPGPAMASLTFGGTSGLVFMAAMVAGMLVAPPLRRALDRPATA